MQEMRRSYSVTTRSALPRSHRARKPRPENLGKQKVRGACAGARPQHWGDFAVAVFRKLWRGRRGVSADPNRGSARVNSPWSSALPSRVPAYRKPPSSIRPSPVRSKLRARSFAATIRPRPSSWTTPSPVLRRSSAPPRCRPLGVAGQLAAVLGAGEHAYVALLGVRLRRPLVLGAAKKTPNFPNIGDARARPLL